MSAFRARPLLLLTGAGGLLAPYVARSAAGRFDVVAVARSSGDERLDLTEAAAVEATLGRLRPNAVVHAAAFTDVDGCERDPARAFAQNALAAANLARAMDRTAHLTLVSTDQVYSDVLGPHVESAAAPVNAYGRTKLAGEWAARAEHPTTFVARTNFFGASLSPGRASLSDFFERSFAQARPVLLFEDMLFSPLHVATLADLLVEVAYRRMSGVFNLGAREGMSKADFARTLARIKSLPTGSARSGASDAIPERAPRARDLRLDVDAIERALGRAMPRLEDEIARTV